MNVNQGEFRKGSWIVHAFYGIGRIIDRVKIKLSGVPKTFLTVKNKDGKYLLAKETTSADYIRPLSSPTQKIKAISIIEEAPRSLPENFFDVKGKIIKTLEDGSILSNARLIRDLHAKKVTSRLKKDERAWLKKLINQFIDEWFLVDGQSKKILRRQLQDVLKTSMAKDKEGDK